MAVELTNELMAVDLSSVVGVACGRSVRMSWDLEQVRPGIMAAHRGARLQSFQINFDTLLGLEDSVQAVVLVRPHYIASRADGLLIEHLTGVALAMLAERRMVVHEINRRGPCLLATGNGKPTEQEIMAAAESYGEKLDTFAKAMAYWDLRFAQKELGVCIED